MATVEPKALYKVPERMDILYPDCTKSQTQKQLTVEEFRNRHY